MKKFLVTYHAPESAREQTANATPEQQAAGMQMWMQWAQRTGDSLLDLGSPLMGAQQINSDGATADSSRQMGGYSIVQAENMEEAIALFEGHPHTSGWNKEATIELHEMMPVPGM